MEECDMAAVEADVADLADSVIDSNKAGQDGMGQYE